MVNDTPEWLHHLCKRLDWMKSERGNFDAHYQEIANYVTPNSHWFTDRPETQGTRRNLRVYDVTAELANNTMAAALQGMLTNPSEPWFELRIENDLQNLEAREEVKLWLMDVRNKMMAEFNSPQTNFDNQNHEIFLSLGAFGTAVMFIGDSMNLKDVEYKTIPLSQCYIAENFTGVVDTLFRCFTMTARQMVQKFGENNVSDKVLEKIQQNKADDKFEVVHAVLPTEDVGDGVLKSKAFASLYFDKKHKYVMRRRGFDMFPYVVPRWAKLTGETYGRSPTMTVLPDIKMLNEMMKTIIRSAQKSVDPPIWLPSEGAVGRIRTYHGAINYFQPGMGDQIQVPDLGGDTRLGVDMLQLMRETIRQAYNINLFELPERPKSHQEMREVEVLSRKQDQQLLLTPTLTRLQREYFGPLIKLTYNRLVKSGKLPPTPPALANTRLEIEYVSPVVRAQRALQADGLNQFIQLSAPLGQIDPNVFDNIDIDGAARYLMDLMEVPVQARRAPDQVQAKREARAQQEAQQQALLAAESLSSSVKNVAQAQSEGLTE